MPHTSTPGTRRRAGLILGSVLATAALALIAVVIFIAHTATAPVSTIAPSPAPPAPEPAVEAERNELAARPMLNLPSQAGLPQPMTTATAGPPITLPAPASTVGRWIPGGLPGTQEGALAQLKALDETALTGGDPALYARGYRETSAPGAPQPETTPLFAALTAFRASAALPATGPAPGMHMSYEVTQGQIKGTVDGGRYVVVCVLGQMTATNQGQGVSVGAGDCQAMTWNGADWQVAPGRLAATAPSAWPGSADAVKAGYRELT